jgi:DNA-directed RNA polymerase specialized sigma24 family protein
MPAVLSTDLPRTATRKNHSEQTITPEQAVEQLAAEFRRVARRLLPGKQRCMREDLVQEMSLSCLNVRKPMPASYFFSRAVNDAIDFLIHEKRHDRLKLMPHKDVCEIIEAGQRVNA